MPYAQLGTTIFDGYKSFVTFSQDEEAVLVEHALIGRKPRLEGAGLGLRTITIDLYLHQEFCKVEDEIAKLRKSKDTFEVLPLLWGNGKVEGSFVIKQMTSDKAIQDAQGNTYAANVNVILLECVVDDLLDQQQQEAQKNAFATNKKPATKSNRVNIKSCQKQIADSISSIRSNGAKVDSEMQGFNYQTIKQNVIFIGCKDIIPSCSDIVTATNTKGSCVYNNASLQSAANNVWSWADGIKGDVYDRSVPLSTLKDENSSLQSAIASLIKVAAPIMQKAIIP